MIFAITNQKGGVGKTTSVINLGAYIASNKSRVLLVDTDPQSNLTSGLGLSTDKSKSIYQFLIGKTSLDQIIKKTRINNLSIIPASIELAGAEIELVHALSRETILKKGLEQIYADYDYILIDCPPSLGLLTINGLVSADRVLIPVQAEYFALEGLGQLVNTVKLVKNNLNPLLDIGGVIITMFDGRTNLSKDVGNEIEDFFKEKMFKTMIPRNIKLSESPSRGLSIMEYAPSSAGAVAYRLLAEEIINKFGKSPELVRPGLHKRS